MFLPYTNPTFPEVAESMTTGRHEPYRFRAAYVLMCHRSDPDPEGSSLSLRKVSDVRPGTLNLNAADGSSTDTPTTPRSRTGTAAGTVEVVMTGPGCERAIDIFEHDDSNEAALKDLVRPSNAYSEGVVVMDEENLALEDPSQDVYLFGRVRLSQIG